MAKEDDLILGNPDEQIDQDDTDLWYEWLEIQHNIRENIDKPVLVHSYFERIDPKMCDARTGADIEETKSNCLDLIIDGIRKLKN